MLHMTDEAPKWASQDGKAEESEEPDGMFCSQSDGMSVLREHREAVSDYFVSVFLISVTQISSLMSSFLFPFLPGLFYRDILLAG